MTSGPLFLLQTEPFKAFLQPCVLTVGLNLLGPYSCLYGHLQTVLEPVHSKTEGMYGLALNPVQPGLLALLC